MCVVKSKWFENGPAVMIRNLLGGACWLSMQSARGRKTGGLWTVTFSPSTLWLCIFFHCVYRWGCRTSTPAFGCWKVCMICLESISAVVCLIFQLQTWTPALDCSKVVMKIESVYNGLCRLTLMWEESDVSWGGHIESLRGADSCSRDRTVSWSDEELFVDVCVFVCLCVCLYMCVCVCVNLQRAQRCHPTSFESWSWSMYAR